MRRRLLPLLIIAALAVPLTAAQTAATAADKPVVSENPVDWTPHVLDGEVRAITVVNDTVVVGGDFTNVSDSSGANLYERWYLFAYSLSTGKVLDFDPDLDGPVLSLAPGPDGTVYVGGSFRTVGGALQRGITRLNVATGKRDAGFTAKLSWGDVRSIALSGKWLYLGGWFDKVNTTMRSGLARVDPGSGAVDTGFDPKLAAPDIGRVKVEDLAVSPSGDRLVAIGALTEVAGTYRVQIAMWDLKPATPRLANWFTEAYNKPCNPAFDTYMRGVDFSPGGDYFVVVTTGRLSSPKLLCDGAARFETYSTGKVDPTWVNLTGGDSLYAVEVTDGAVYVGGHQRWLDNPQGKESAGPGAVSRVGIAAINPSTGKALPWNPTRDRGVGLRAFAITPKGLIVGSDTEKLGHEHHGRIGMFPY